MTQHKWMQSAVKHPGSLRRWLGVKEGQRISLSLLRDLLKRSMYRGKRITPHRRRQIRLALIFARYRPGRR